MRKLMGTTLIALIAMTSQVVGQSADTQDRPGSAAVSGQSERAAGTASRAGQSPQGASSTQSARTTQTSSASATSGQNALEQHIAAALLLGNQEEIALSQFGMQRAQHDQVKQFAQEMIEQHQQAVSQIEKAAPEVASWNLQLSSVQGASSDRNSDTARTTPGTGQPSATAGATATNSSQANSATGNQRTTTPSAGSQGGSSQEMVDYMRRVKEQCISLTQQELGRKQGAEFDKAFMGMQISLHTGMLAHLQAAQESASSQMRPVIQQGTEMTQHHLTQARQIMEQLDAGGQGGATAARPETPGTQR